jgi:pSer/pThr/pTyr-binding forkhead associated (FHA) protein
MNSRGKNKSIGRDTQCDIVLNHESVSRLHAHIHVTEEGFLAVHDANSRMGTFLNRNQRWIRIKKVILGTEDRIRFGELEVTLEKLVAAFSGHPKVRLRDGYSVRGKPLVFDQSLLDLPKPKVILEHPRRNPSTGIIEENR